MPIHVVSALDDFPAGTRKVLTVAGRKIVVFNVGGSFYGLLDRCPHQGGSLALGSLGGVVTSEGPGQYGYDCARMLVRCPWHGWQFDIRTGQSWCEPDRMKLPTYQVEVEAGSSLAAGPYVAETVEVAVEGQYVVIKT